MQVSGDTLHIDAKTAAGQPAQRLNASPSFLELTFPKAKQAGNSVNKAIDRGLVQKVQTTNDGQTVSIRVFVVSKPKATLTKTADGYRYSIRMSEPAGVTPVAAAKPTAVAKPAANTTKPNSPWTIKTNPDSEEAPVATKPVAPTSKPAAQPAQPAAQASKPVTQPAQPAAQASKPVTQPAQPVAQPPVATASPSGRDPRQLITVVFQNRPIGDALTELALQAGYTAQIDPALSGAVNLSLSEVPFEDALGLLLEPYGNTVTSTVGPQSITVKKRAAATPTVSSAGSNQIEGIVQEYYPFSNKDAQKMMDAASKAVPELTYRVDPVLNVLLVQGPREHVVRLGELLKKMSTK